MEKKSIIVSGGIGSATSCLTGGFAIWAPDMIVPPLWGVVLMCLGIAIALATIIYACWPLRKEEANKNALSTHQAPPNLKPRIELASLGEGNFDGIVDSSDRPFLKAGKTDKIAFTRSKFGKNSDEKTDDQYD